MKRFAIFAIIFIVASHLPLYSSEEIELQNLKRQPDPEITSSPKESMERPRKREEVLKAKPEPKLESYVPGEIIVKYKEGKENQVAAAIKEKNLVLKQQFSKGKIQTLEIKDGKSVLEKIEEIKGHSDIEYVQPNYIYYPTSISTNDTYRNRLWGLYNYGQSVNGQSGTTDADIDAPEAWSNYEESTHSDVIVAVIDSGVAYNHPDISSNMWDGSSGCKDENGDTIVGGCPNHGWDFYENDNDPAGSSDHGTHIAGIIAAIPNNSSGVIGLSRYNNLKIMALKTSLTSSENIKAIQFAEENGADVINASWACCGSDEGGGPICGDDDYDDQVMIDAIESFSGLFVAAAGNGGCDSDVDGDNHEGAVSQYPCDHTSNNIICVAASNQSDELTSWSDYGATSVDIAAPGENIYSHKLYRVLDEDFEDVTPPSVGPNFSESGDNTWGTYDFGTTIVAYGDLNYPFGNNIDSYITSSTYDLGGLSEGFINFDYSCSTEGSAYDYIYLSIWDGANWVNGSPKGGSAWGSASYDISDYANSGFRLTLAWHTDSSGSYWDGCWVDNIELIDSTSTNESYKYLDGTSMATPYVAGAAGLMYSYSSITPSASQIKNILLTTGDSLSSLSGKVSSGRRLNLYNAYAEADTALSLFSDTPISSVFYDYIESLANDNVICGYADSTFKPGYNVTRGQMAKFVKNGFGFETETSCGEEFTDVDPEDVFYEYIMTLKCRGVICGYSDGSFRSGRDVTRGQAMKFVINGARDIKDNPDFLPNTTSNTFSDVGEDHPFHEYIMSAYSNDIVCGYSDETFRPGNPTTRGQISKMIENSRNKL
jgi:subtilisin family serine protease